MGVSVYGCVVVRQLAAQALLRVRGEVRVGAVAVVVMEGVRPSERVYAINGAARALGLHAGMTRVEVETFDGVEMLARSREEEARARDVLRGAMGRFSPRVEERGEGVDWECVLDLSGTERLLGSPDAVGRALLEALWECGLQARVVVCGNADAGLSLGRVGAGVQVVAEGEEAVALAPLPVGVLRLEAQQAERFTAWGVATLGELAALPEVDLIARMGQSGKTLRLRARGELPHHLEPVEEAVRLEETMEFDEAVETLEPLLFSMNGMLEMMLASARERSLAVAAVTVMLWLERCCDRVVEMEAAEDATPVEERLELVPDVPAPVEVAECGGIRGDSLEERVARDGRLPVRGVSEARLGLASADAAVRKAWHRAALLGEALAAKDVPPVRGEIAARRGLGIGDGQAMQRAVQGEPARVKPFLREAAGLELVCKAKHLAADVRAVKPVQADVSDRFAAAEEGDEGKWGRAFERTVRPAIATVDRALLLKMLQLDLEAHSPEGAVVRVRLVGEAGEMSRIQLGLFAPPLPEPTRFDDTHARLVSLAGEVNVGRMRALDTHASECFALERFLLPTGMRTTVAEQPSQRVPAMALRRMRPPAAVRVMLSTAAIARFWMDGMRFEVERCYGPWRGSGEWWGSGVRSADAWDVAGRGEDGELLVCLLSRDILRDRWMVEGIYD